MKLKVLCSVAFFFVLMSCTNNPIANFDNSRIIGVWIQVKKPISVKHCGIASDSLKYIHDVCTLSVEEQEVKDSSAFLVFESNRMISYKIGSINHLANDSIQECSSVDTVSYTISGNVMFTKDTMNIGFKNDSLVFSNVSNPMFVGNTFTGSVWYVKFEGQLPPSNWPNNPCFVKQ